MNKRENNKNLTFLLMILFLLTGCGYHLVGKGSILPEHIKVIAIPYLDNDSSNSDISQRITENLSKEFSRRGNYNITNAVDDADAVLQGKILSYTSKAISFDSESRAERYEIRVEAEIFFRDLREGELIWENKEIAFREEYDVPSETAEYYNREIEAIDRISELFAETVVASITQGF